MSTKATYPLSADQIQKYLPHRFPFLLIDRIINIETTPDYVGTKVIAIKNVTINEHFLQGHFPGFAIVPGVIIIEAMAQTTGFTLYEENISDLAGFAKKFQTILVGVNNARFRRPVVPGDTMRIESTVQMRRGSLWKFQVEVTVDGQKVAEAEILANLTRTEGGPT